MKFDQVSLIAHADWSVNPTKRWVAISVLQPGGSWSLCELSNVRQPSTLFSHLKSIQAVPGSILAGFDLPIGLPFYYALYVGITDFLSALPLLGHMEWDKFFLPAEQNSEISLHRPFYPAKPWGPKRSHLELGLEITFVHLFRLCEVSQVNRRAACPLF